MWNDPEYWNYSLVGWMNRNLKNENNDKINQIIINLIGSFLYVNT